jgi:hypothetical protein
MLRRTSWFAVAAMLLILPTRLLAGGPPWLCLPIDGATDENLKSTNDLLAANLASKVYPADQFAGVAVMQQGAQSYATVFMKEDVSLSEVESALKGTGISVPHDRMHLFGYATLEIDPRKAVPDEVLAALKGLKHVSVAKSETKDGLLVVTVDMPYPNEEGSRGKSVGWDSFKRGDMSSDQTTHNEPSIGMKSLPTYNTFRDAIAKHDAVLRDIRWTTQYACRTVGACAEPKAGRDVAAADRKK